MRVAPGGARTEGITTLAQNSDPFTYFSKRPVRVCENIAIDDGTLSLAVLRSLGQRHTPMLVSKLLSKSGGAAHQRQIEHFENLTEATTSGSTSESSSGSSPGPCASLPDPVSDPKCVFCRIIAGDKSAEIVLD